MESSLRSSGDSLVPALQAAGATIDTAGTMSIPVENLRSLLDFALERGHLEGLSSIAGFAEPQHAVRRLADGRPRMGDLQQGAVGGGG
jgi:hypothetical protein